MVDVDEAEAPEEVRQRYDSEFILAYRDYYSRIFAFVYSRVRDADLAKDIASEVFERAYVNGDKVRNEGAYASWLFMVARNAVAGHFRKRNREIEARERTRDNLSTRLDPAEPADLAIRSETARQLLKHLRSLPKRDQELISLKFDGELTNAEIGDVMNMDPVNVRVALFRALRRLRDRMEAEAMMETGLQAPRLTRPRRARVPRGAPPETAGA